MRNETFCRVSIREIAEKGGAVAGDSVKCNLRPVGWKLALFEPFLD
jgi:hypothetical protein